MADGAKKENGELRGQPLAIDQSAKSARPGMPAFLSKPEGAPVYHGFPILEDVEVDGFKFGMITDFLLRADAVEGDSFVVAPDGSRGGMVWKVALEERFIELLPIEKDRWGVWEVTFPYPMRTRRDAKRNLKVIVPRLKEKWELWRKLYNS
ncbi:MAG TPA: hypothetical protein VGR72_00620 [Candidatus Acidoferrales bacterium]|nr:hypothetical protein [Candidatus Acidoferrales bacterium]